MRISIADIRPRVLRLIVWWPDLRSLFVRGGQGGGSHGGFTSERKLQVLPRVRGRAVLRVVEVIQNGLVIRKTVLDSVHDHCARDWARAETAGLRRVHGNEARLCQRRDGPALTLWKRWPQLGWLASIASSTRYRSIAYRALHEATLQWRLPTTAEVQRAEDAQGNLKAAKRRYFEACRECSARNGRARDFRRKTPRLARVLLLWM